MARYLHPNARALAPLMGTAPLQGNRQGMTWYQTALLGRDYAWPRTIGMGGKSQIAVRCERTAPLVATRRNQ